MSITPEFTDFATVYDAGENQVIYTRLAADLDTPVSIMMKLAGARKNSFMLESVTGGEIRGRYSIIGIKPDLIWKTEGNHVSINRMARFDDEAFITIDKKPLEAFRDLLAESHINLPHDLPQAAAVCSGIWV